MEGNTSFPGSDNFGTSRAIPPKCSLRAITPTGLSAGLVATCGDIGVIDVNSGTTPMGLSAGLVATCLDTGVIGVNSGMTPTGLWADLVATNGDTCVIGSAH